METILHYFSAIDFTPSLSQIFPAIINPVIHGFGQVFQPIFSRLLNMVELHPSLITGTFFLTMIYVGYSVVEARTKRAVVMEEKILRNKSANVA